MTQIRVIKNWAWPDLNRQTPGHLGVWDDIQFTFDSLSQADYVLVLNRTAQITQVGVPQGHVWALMQEPPNKISKLMHLGDKAYDRIYTCDSSLHGRRYVKSQPALPWHVNRDYDFLKNVSPPDKPHSLSWITSSMTLTSGHQTRMAFLEQLRAHVDFDLWGRGFTPIEDKWDGLAPYRYAIAFENYSNSLYWSEKLADCFLSWTMPIYYGCTQITDYFPRESLIQIDVQDPNAIEQIQDAIASDRWMRNRDAIAYARELILDHYQFFPYMVAEIRRHESHECREYHYRPITLSPSLDPPFSINLARYKLSMLFNEHRVLRFVRRGYDFLKRRLKW